MYKERACDMVFSTDTLLHDYSSMTSGRAWILIAF